jgi:hypothetical protein
VAQKTLVICDQCKREESNDAPHAHSMNGLLPVGWVEINIDHVPARTPEMEEAMRRLRGPLVDGDGDVIDAEFVELAGHRHHFAKKKTSSLCPECASKLSIRCGDAEVMFADVGGGDILGGILPPGFGPLRRRPG